MLNRHGQPVGEPVVDWEPCPYPSSDPMVGRWCRLERLDPDRHAIDLFRGDELDAEGSDWTYLSHGPYATLEEYLGWARAAAAIDDPMAWAIVDALTGQAVGVACYLRIDRPNGVIEVGGIKMTPPLQRTVAATEAMYLMARRAFDEHGYRRYEWKCDSLNAPSRRAATRLGFTFEGEFRQAVVVKGRNRDTAWFSITDAEWRARRQVFEAWLAPTNFDADGRQVRRLGDFAP